jgi:uroporphyrinogen-III synthase
VTAGAARDLGIRVDVVPATFTLDALVRSLAGAPDHARTRGL